MIRQPRTIGLASYFGVTLRSSSAAVRWPFPFNSRLVSTSDVVTATTRRRRIAVGISGGVDSSVTAMLLRDYGWDVIGVYMRNWDNSDEAGEGACRTTDDEISARRVCEKLRIPMTTLDFTAVYWTRVFEPFLASYAAGLTPNPDILCNRHVKFGAFRAAALSPPPLGLGCDALATGHYATVNPAIDATNPSAEWPEAHSATSSILPRLLAAVDGSKDQSDFLAAVDGRDLRGVLFPLGRMLKRDVRRIAVRRGLPTAERRDSYGICFVGERSKLATFLASYMRLTPGRFLDIDSDFAPVGQHDGAEAWTPGQRARIGGASAPYFVVSRAGVDTGDVLVAQGHAHAALFCDELVAVWRDVRWVAGKPPLGLCEERQLRGANLRVRYRIRHRQAAMGTAFLRVARYSEFISDALATVSPDRQWHDASRNLTSAWNGQTVQLDEPNVAGFSDVNRTSLPTSARSLVTSPPHSHVVSHEWKDADPLVLVVRFGTPQRAVAPGQVIVFYADGVDGSVGDVTHVNENVSACAHKASELPPHDDAAAAVDEQDMFGNDGNATAPTWVGAHRECFGCAPILLGGPSYWHRGLIAPLVWEE